MEKIENKKIDFERKDVLICERIITSDNKELESYKNFLIEYIKSAIKDNHLIVFIIINFEEDNENENSTKPNISRKIKKWLKSFNIEINEQFLFIKKDETFDFNLAFGLDNKYLFAPNNTICIFEDPTIGEQLFFNNFFNVFFSTHEIECVGNYKATTKVSYCVIDDDTVTSWNYDRINYEFFSFLESTSKN